MFRDIFNVNFTEKVKNITLDKLVILISLIYIILPVSIFCFGWMKIYYALPIAVLLIYFGYKAFAALTKGEAVHLVTRDGWLFWTVIVVVSFVWVFFSGIGGFTYQNGDFWARNPMYWDLCDYSWPVVFDLSKESEAVQSIAGSSEVAFSYYFSWWLAPALISKVFGLGKTGREILLYFYAVLGVLCVMYCLVRFFKKRSFIIPVVMVAFSGIDIVGYIVSHKMLPSLTGHIEWWPLYFQMTSNTALLFFVFNQAIPLWIILILMLQISNDNMLGLISLSFAYSPWATIGIVPIALSRCIGKGKGAFKKVVREFISVQNITVGLIMLVAYGLFYTCGQSSGGQTGFIFSLYSNKLHVIKMLILFWFCDIFVFFIVMGRRIRNYEFYYVLIAEFIIMPLFRVIQYSWLIRGLIPASFILMIYCMRFLMEKSGDKSLRIRKALLICVLVVGAFTPLTEFSRSIVNVVTNGPTRNETVYTFGDIHDEGIGNVAEIKDIYFKYDYEDSLFFRYLAR